MSVVTVGNPHQAHYDAMANTMRQARESLPHAPLAPAPGYRAPAPGSAEEARQRAMYQAMSQPMHAEHPLYLDMKADHDEYAADPAAWHAKHVARINKAWAPYRTHTSPVHDSAPTNENASKWISRSPGGPKNYYHD